MKKILIAILFSVLLLPNAFSQIAQNDNYQFFVNLNNVENDRLTIELITPLISSDKVLYKFPAMIPGTYKIYDFGRFVSELKAFDNSGNELAVERKDDNTWEISNANNLYKITYNADDTFDDTSGVTPIFEPAGTNIEKDTVFVVNNHGFFGYLDGYIENDYTLTFTKPTGFYGSTSLNSISRTDTEEIFTAQDYQFLVDNPILFSVPDTISINFDEAKVIISVYSEGKGMSASDFSQKMKSLLSAIRDYLGGKLPADRYTFIFYFSGKKGTSGSFGALEHSYSSLYYMPDVPKSAAPFMVAQLQSTSAHEFYHIVTPLNLHAEEIGNFDFNNPVMSKHLWLYEGVTEYNADYIQLTEGLINLKDYAGIIEEKMNGASKYNDTLPFTEMSKGALREYENQYLNVYMKGALIGLCLDIIIREESGGQQGLQDVLNKLLEKYGKENSFKDDELFAEITALTYPKVGEFFDRYIQGAERIPYNDILNKVGITVESTPYKVADLGGGVQMGFNQENFRLKVVNVDYSQSKFLKELGLQKDDELLKINGTPITFHNMKEVFGSQKNQAKIGDEIELVVARYDGGGKENQVALKAKIDKTKTVYENKITVTDKPDAQQEGLRNLWMGK